MEHFHSPYLKMVEYLGGDAIQKDNLVLEIQMQFFSLVSKLSFKGP